MRAVFKRVLCMVILLVLLCVSLVMTASADTGQQKDTWNIMLVIDGSASLWSGIKSDPDGLRYEAIKSFLYTLESHGNMVGAIVFNANQTTDPSDKAMATSILVNTGILSLTASAELREELATNIEGAKKINTNTEQTDIGTALLVAERELQKVKDNGNRSAVFLFSDGDMQVNKYVMDKAMENLHTAEKEMKENNITFCGVLLDVNGNNNTDVKDIAYAANGIIPGMDLGNHYIEINDSASCAESTDRFLELLGYQVEAPEAVYDSFVREFRVPGIGVEEATIRLRTDKGNPIPKDIQVVIIKPDGTSAPASELASIYSVGRTYHAYKLEQPESGKWTVCVTVPEGNSIAIFYSPVVSFSIEAGLKTDIQPVDMYAGQTVNVECFLMRNNNAIKDPACYQEYECELVLTDMSTGKEERIKVAPNNGVFSVPLTMSYGVYQAHTEFFCDELRAVSEPLPQWEIVNHPPTTRDHSESIIYNFLEDGALTLDLEPFIDDLEDGKNLAVAITGGTCDLSSVSLKGYELSLAGKSSGSGTITLSVTDTQGASAAMTVTVKVTSQNTYYIIAAAAVLAAILAAVLLIVSSRNKNKPEGSLTIEMTVPDGEGGEFAAAGGIKRPNTDGMPFKCTLDRLLEGELRGDFNSIRDCFDGDESKYDKLLNFLNSAKGKAFTQSIHLKPVKIKSNGKKAIAVQVSRGKEHAKLYNSGTPEFRSGEAKIKLSYYRRNPDEEDGNTPIVDTGLEYDPYDPGLQPIEDDDDLLYPMDEEAEEPKPKKAAKKRRLFK